MRIRDFQEARVKRHSEYAIPKISYYVDVDTCRLDVALCRANACLDRLSANGMEVCRPSEVQSLASWMSTKARQKHTPELKCLWSALVSPVLAQPIPEETPDPLSMILQEACGLCSRASGRNAVTSSRTHVPMHSCIPSCKSPTLQQR